MDDCVTHIKANNGRGFPWTADSYDCLMFFACQFIILWQDLLNDYMYEFLSRTWYGHCHLYGVSDIDHVYKNEYDALCMSWRCVTVSVVT